MTAIVGPLTDLYTPPTLPTDDQLDAAIRAAGFTHCHGRPYWWTLPDSKPPVRGIIKPQSSDVKMVSSTRRKKKA